MAKIKRKEGDEAKRKKERERKRKYRESIKENAEKLEKVRQYDRERKRKCKEEGKIKSITDMNDREKRCQRKRWTAATRKYRQNKKLNEEVNLMLELNTPPNSPQLSISSDLRKSAGNRRARQRREKDKKKLKKLQKDAEKAKNDALKWRMRYKRLKEKIKGSPSPKKVVESIMKKGPTDVKRNLMFGISLKMQVQKNSENCSSQNKKKILAENISGHITSRQKLKSIIAKEKIISAYYQRRACKDRGRNRKEKETHISRLKKTITTFYEDPENSCETPGKRDCITRKKVKKQVRYLLFPKKELYKKFKNTTGNKHISYSSFAKLCPFWVKEKKVDKRDTCMCIIHTNFKYKIQKLRLLRLLRTDSTTDIIRKSVCDINNKPCMFGNCTNCSISLLTELQTKENDFEDFNTFYYQWIVKREVRPAKKGDKPIKVQMTVKEKVFCKASQLITEANKDIKEMGVHIYNMNHQLKTFKEILNRMTDTEAAVLCDWSENYNCKYTQEVQGVHFGASRNQVSLHTGMVYIGDSTSDVKKRKFCTVSDETRHDATAVWAHLVPILSMINSDYPKVKYLHFFSDGPTSQYRNKTNFFLLCKICSNFDFEHCSWNFWEAGHGKGPADGIGGIVKRTCDKAVAMGQDVMNAADCMAVIRNLNIDSFLVQQYEISLMSYNICELDKKLVAVKGTMQLKCVLWSKGNEPYLIKLRELSCANCRNSGECNHFPSSRIPSTWNLIHQDQKNMNVENSIHLPTTSDQQPNDLDSISRPGPSSTISNKKKQVYHEIYSSSESSETDQEWLSVIKQNELLIKRDAFLLVKLEGKKSFRHYVGKVIETHDDGDVSVSFLRQSVGGKFVFPDIKDEKCIVPEEIVCVLSKPKVSRGRYIFDDLSSYQNLN